MLQADFAVPQKERRCPSFQRENIWTCDARHQSSYADVRSIYAIRKLERLQTLLFKIGAWRLPLQNIHNVWV